MARAGRRARAHVITPIAVIAALGMAGCTTSISTHGHRLDAAALAQIEPGQSSQGDVIQLLGSPSSLATFDDHTWYYISQRTERHSFYHSSIVAQDVVAIVFDDQGTVNQVNRHDLNGAMDVDLVGRETPTSGNEMSVLEQFLGNIGRFNPVEEEELAAGRGFRRRPPPSDQTPPSAARISNATMLMILIIGLTAGPAVSL